MKQLYLTGFMGSGKSTVGSILAEQLGVQGVDTDRLIEEQEKMSISEIFGTYGEEYFRSLETDLLKELPDDNILIITGGGMVLKPENRRWMKENGVVIYLRCEMDEIKRRLQHDTSRPLLSGKRIREIQSVFDERKGLYEEAEIIVDTTGKKPDFIAREIVECLKSR